MAFFSDEENFANNQLTAGSLDLKVDFEEHYVDWIGTEGDPAPDGSTEAIEGIEMGVPEAEADIFLPESATGDVDDTKTDPISLGLPDGVSVAEFFDASSVDAYPDTDDDGVQDFPDEFDICERDDADADTVLDSDLRTEQFQGEPVISLNDVKPGDFGEVTLSFHLCDNPGFVWLFCDDVEAAENGTTEPEAEDPDEEDGVVELLDEVQVRTWIDDGDNIYEPEAQPIDLYHLFDTSGTMEQDLAENDDTRDKEDVAARIAERVTENLDAQDSTPDNGTLEDAEVSVAEAGGNDGSTNELVNDEDDESAIVDAIDNTPDTSAGGISGDDLVAAFEDAEDDLVDTETDDDFLIFYTNGDSRPDSPSDRDDVVAAADGLKNQGVTIKVVAHGTVGTNAQQFLEDISDEVLFVPGGATGADVDDAEDDAVESINAQLEQDLTGGESTFFEGTLREFCETAEFDRDTGALGVPLDGDLPAAEGGGSADARNCFTPSTPHYVAFEWWLPVNHANEIQTDSVSFDLGFYAEQCRHNDGMANDDNDDNDDNG
jgi:hypothetical protein